MVLSHLFNMFYTCIDRLAACMMQYDPWPMASIAPMIYLMPGYGAHIAGLVHSAGMPPTSTLAVYDTHGCMAPVAYIDPYDCWCCYTTHMIPMIPMIPTHASVYAYIGSPSLLHETYIRLVPHSYQTYCLDLFCSFPALPLLIHYISKFCPVLLRNTSIHCYVFALLLSFIILLLSYT